MTRAPRRRGRWAVVVAVVGALAACGGPDQAVERSAPVATSTTVETTSTTSSAPDATTTITAVPATTTTAPVCPAPTGRTQPAPDRPNYRVQVSADPDTGVVTGIQHVTFTPDLPVDHLVLRLWGNAPRPASAGTSIAITELDEGGEPRPTAQPDPTTVVVELGRTVAPGSAIRLHLQWRLQVGGPVDDRISRQDGSLRLGSFVPLLAWQPGVGWATEPATSGFAEAATSPTANWRYSVTVPEGFSVLASGLTLPDGTYVAQAVRDIAVSVGRFTVISASTHLPNLVLVTVGVHDGIDDPGNYLGPVIGHLKELAARFGPYPWPAYTVSITPDLGGGIEYPMHVMQGPGTDGRTTPHEAAHMWFYGLVGNNQALHPYLDEGLATYAEGRLLGSLDAMAAKRVPADGIGRAGADMAYWEPRPRSYYRSVYVQTAVALARLGDLDRVDCALARYVSENAYSIATPDDLVRALDEVFTDWRPVLAAAGLP